MMEAYVIGIVFMLISLFVSWRLKSKFKQYSQIQLRANLTGAQAAQKMLDDEGVRNVRIISTPGQLTDHYNPADRTVNLSEEVYHGRNAAAVAVAAHECGHAVQHARAYGPLQMRSKLVPVVSVASRYMQWVILAGILMINTSLMPLAIGVGLFALTTLFSFVTLPVEFDASKRALAWIDKQGVVTSQEYTMAKDALWWAAMTYVVAALGSLATLLYYASILFGRRD